MPPSSGSTGGERVPCPSCSRPVQPDTTCPHCGHQAGGLADELAQVDKALSEMSATNVELEKQRKSLAGKMQAAKHQRDVLARALAGQPSGTRRPPPAERQRRRDTRQVRRPGTQPPPPAQPALRARPSVAPLPDSKPEASSRSVQAIMLALGALLLGIAGVTFVGVAITLDAWGQLAIVAGVTVLALGVAPVLATRGLTSTAEAIAAVGLLLIGVAGYALWPTGVVAALPPPLYAGLVAACTAAAGYGYHRLTGLVVPRYGALIALQLVLPLVAYQLVTGPVGWAIVFTAVAAHNAWFGHLDRRRVPVAWPQQLAWVLHGLALGAATGYAGTALAVAGTVPAAATAGGVLVAAMAVGLAGTLSLRYRPLPDLAAGLMTLAVMVAAARVAIVAGPETALLPVAGVVALTSFAGRLLPEHARRGPQLASAAALALLGAFVALLAARAAAATVVLPPWPAGATGSAAAQADVVGALGWQLSVAAAILTVAAVVALPAATRHEGATTGAALTALAAPASFALAPVASAWVLVVAAVGLGMAGVDADRRRVAMVHVVAAGAVGLTAVGAALAAAPLTSAILAALTVSGAVLATGRTRSAPAAVVAQWAGGAAALALPGAAATGAAAGGIGTSGVLAAASAGVCVSLAYTVRVLLARRIAPVPLTMGTGIGAVVVGAAALAAGDAATVDLGIAGLLVLAAVLLYATPRIDATRRRDRLLDGADLAAAAVTAASVATLVRITWLVLPDPGGDGALAIAAALVCGVAFAIRLLPRQWRRGPVLGVSLFGALVAGIAGSAAAITGTMALAQLWDAGLAGWPPAVGLAGLAWAPPLTLGALAFTAALVLPRPGPRVRTPGAAEVSAALGVLAAVGAAPALGLPWWGPAAVTAAAGAGYGVSAVGIGSWRPTHPRTARARGYAAAVLAMYASAAGLVRPWTAALVLGVIVLVGVAMAVRTMALATSGSDPRLPIGGAATAAALLVGPGALAALAVQLGHTGGLAFLAAMAGSSLGLAVLAITRSRAGPLLAYGTVGIAGGASAIAVVSVPTGQPTGVYAAAAVLLAVLAELVRTRHRHRSGLAGSGERRPAMRLADRVSPATGALLAAAVPVGITLFGMAPALRAALLDPYQVLTRPWAGPPPALLHLGDVPATNALAALLLTLASALAAAGFGGAVTRQTAPVVAPGLALTLLISPAALGLPWPATTVAGLLVFTLAMLGVALTPPPAPGLRYRVLRANRLLVLAIGLAAGSAGLAGSLADPSLTWATFGGAIAVGATAALGGRTRTARMFGWLGAVLSAQLFMLTTALLAGVTRPQSGLFLLVVAAIALLVVTRLRRLRTPAARAELAIVEWFGGYATLGLGVALAAGSLPDLSALLLGAGAVLGFAALRADRPDRWRRGLLWAAVACLVGGVWIMMWLLAVDVLEAYTVPLAVFALLAGALELPRRPELSSWVVYGPGLLAALAPSLVAVVLVAGPQPARQGWVLLGGTAALLFGSRSRQRAPVIVGSTMTALTALHLLSLAGPWLVLIPIAVLLLYLGGKSERRQRDLEQIRGALNRMR